MDGMEELIRNNKIEEERKASYMSGYYLGKEEANWTFKRNKAVESMLLAFVGYEKEWLTSPASYNKLNKKDLIKVILEQRELMNLSYNHMSDEKKKEFKKQVDMVVWDRTFD